MTGRYDLVVPDADQVIDLFALAIRHRLTAGAIEQAMFAHPSGASDIGHMLQGTPAATDR